MWKSFEIDGNYFIFKIKSEENCLKVTISDLKSIWREELSSTDILCRFKEINPAFECNENIKESVFSMIDNIDKALEKKTEWKNDDMVLDIKSELEQKYKIGFRFVMKKLQQEEYFSEVTLPMVQTILHLEQSQGNLHDLLKKKDRELQEYKLEKGEITRDDLKTQPYDCNAIGNFFNGVLMLKLFDKRILPEATYQICHPAADSNKSVLDVLKKTKPLKRKIYSAKKSNKKPSL